MADINIEIDPEIFEKLSTELLNRFRALEIELAAYKAMFKRLEETYDPQVLNLVLNTMLRSRVVVVNIILPVPAHFTSATPSDGFPTTLVTWKGNMECARSFASSL